MGVRLGSYTCSLTPDLFSSDTNSTHMFHFRIRRHPGVLFDLHSHKDPSILTWFDLGIRKHLCVLI